MNAIAKIESLPRLIQEAATALAKATNAAEVLEAKAKANVVYDAAKLAARLSNIKDAHDTVLAACHKAMGDALVIETRAQCRLADEYEAAQERGDVQKKGGKRGNQFAKVLDENFGSKLADIGLDKKQVHEARVVRDAEKAEPGIVRKIVEAKLQAGEEPNRAAVKRAIKPKAVKRAAPTPHKKQDHVAVLMDQGLAMPEIAERLNVGKRQVRHIVERVEIERKAKAEVEITPDMLPKSAQEKLDSAIRQHQRKLDATFEARVAAEVVRRIDEIVLPHWKAQIEEAKRIFDRRKGFMSKDIFNTIRRGLHPDSRNGISDKKLGEAFDAFMGLEKHLLDEKESPTPFHDVPSSLAEWDKLRAKRRATRPSGPTAVKRKN